MAHYQDFVGLNTFIYDPNGWDINQQHVVGFPSLTERERLSIIIGGFEQSVYLQQNHIGIPNDLVLGQAYTIRYYKNYKFPLNLPTTASFFNALMSHRGNVYGYSSWRQIRVGNNPLTRKQRENNVFTYVVEPGQVLEEKIARYGDIKVFREPVVVSNYKPISVVGEVSLYNEVIGEFQNKSVEIKTSFGNETAFFANDEINRYFETIEETDQNYESLKELYLNGGLQDEGSPIDAFNLLVYRQTVFPKQQYSYLDNTRSRNFYVNTFWRDDRLDRTQTSVDSGFGAVLPSQSMWPLDVASDWATRGKAKDNDISIPPTFVDVHFYAHYIGGKEGGWFPSSPVTKFPGFNTGDVTGLLFSSSLGGAGILMNSYAQLTNGFYDFNSNSAIASLGNIAGSEAFDNLLSASCYLSRRHTMTNINSVVSPSGMTIKETGSLTEIEVNSLFEGLAAWDAGRQAGKTPFYDSYQDWAQEIRLKGKGYSVVPEFRISSHVETYEKKGITEELKPIFELSGGLSQHTTTENALNFYQVLSTTDFLKHFDLVKKDHKDLADEKILTIKCKALKKFLPYEGFYPAQKTVDLAKRFYQSYKDNVTMFSGNSKVSTKMGFQGLLEPLFAPGVLFNTIKSGIAVDFPIISNTDDPEYIKTNLYGDEESLPFPQTINYMLAGSNLMPADSSAVPSSYNISSIFSKRIGFESLIEPEKFLSNLDLRLQEPHPFGLSSQDIFIKWDGQGDRLYKKMINNFLAEVPEFFLQKGQLTTIVSEEEQNPEFGNAVAGNFYAMRIKMQRSRNKDNDYYEGIEDTKTFPPQDAYSRLGIQETFTMYSRPTAFGSPIWGGIQSGSNLGSITNPLGDLWGSNYCYTPPYYYGESWCDVIFECTQTKKYTVDEILSKVRQYPYYTRFWWPGVNDALRDLSGYLDNSGISTIGGPYEDFKNTGSPWKSLLTNGWSSNSTSTIINGNQNDSINSLYTDYVESWLDNSVHNYPTDLSWMSCYINNGVISKTAPQHPSLVNTNAMQLNSSVNLFSKGTVRSISDNLSEDGSTFEVASADTVKGKTRWIIQTKFETPMLNFNKYTDLSANNLTIPQYASESVPRGIWHQYGEIPEDPKTGVFLQVEDIPESWFKGALGINENYTRKKVKSLADLVGFRKEPVKLGQVAELREISEAVVAVPFIEKDGTRKFFSIPRADIDSCIDATKRETGQGRFVLGGPAKAGDTVYKMVKNMQKYVFPPSMDFVKYEEVEPFAMYIFEFKHNLSKKDVADIWQNLPPEIGNKIEESEASISHELLAHELLGGGSVIKNGMLDENAEGQGIPSNIQWMIFKVKKRAKTNYYDKVVAGSGTTQDTSKKTLENVTSAKSGKIEKDITYNWPYDYFSLVELVKLDAEVTFAQIGNDDKGQKTIKKVEPPKPKEGETPFPKLKAKGFMKALGKGKKGKGK